MNKEKYSVYLTDKTINLADSFYRLDGCPTRSMYIERAIGYYTAHLANGVSDDYLSDEINRAIKRELTSFENHISKLLFRFSVEMDMMMNVVAASLLNVEADQLSKLRAQCVEHVKNTRGQLSFEKAVAYQNGGKDE